MFYISFTADQLVGFNGHIGQNSKYVERSMVFYIVGLRQGIAVFNLKYTLEVFKKAFSFLGTLSAYRGKCLVLLDEDFPLYAKIIEFFLPVEVYSGPYLGGVVSNYRRVWSAFHMKYSESRFEASYKGFYKRVPDVAVAVGPTFNGIGFEGASAGVVTIGYNDADMSFGGFSYSIPFNNESKMSQLFLLRTAVSAVLEGQSVERQKFLVTFSNMAGHLTEILESIKYLSIYFFFDVLKTYCSFLLSTIFFNRASYLTYSLQEGLLFFDIFYKRLLNFFFFTKNLLFPSSLPTKDIYPLKKGIIMSTFDMPFKNSSKLIENVQYTNLTTFCYFFIMSQNSFFFKFFYFSILKNKRFVDSMNITGLDMFFVYYSLIIKFFYFLNLFYIFTKFLHEFFFFFFDYLWKFFRKNSLEYFDIIFIIVDFASIFLLENFFYFFNYLSKIEGSALVLFKSFKNISLFLNFYDILLEEIEKLALEEVLKGKQIINYNLLLKRYEMLYGTFLFKRSRSTVLFNEFNKLYM